jgi:hypothetical protein
MLLLTTLAWGISPEAAQAYLRLETCTVTERNMTLAAFEAFARSTPSGKDSLRWLGGETDATFLRHTLPRCGVAIRLEAPRVLATHRFTLTLPADSVIWVPMHLDVPRAIVLAGPGARLDSAPVKSMVLRPIKEPPVLTLGRALDKAGRVERATLAGSLRSDGLPFTGSVTFDADEYISAGVLAEEVVVRGRTMEAGSRITGRPSPDLSVTTNQETFTSWNGGFIVTNSREKTMSFKGVKPARALLTSADTGTLEHPVAEKIDLSAGVVEVSIRADQRETYPCDLLTFRSTVGARCYTSGQPIRYLDKVTLAEVVGTP